MRFLISAVTLLFALIGCRKSADIESHMQPAVDNATAFQGLAAHAFIPTAEVLRDWGNSRASVPFLLLTDSGIWFDYKKGVVCTDGLVRQGKCLVKNGFSLGTFQDTCWFSSTSKDSFAILGSKGPVYFSGKLKFTNFSAYYISVSGNAEIRSRDGDYAVSLEGLIRLDAEGQTTRSAKFKTIWTADVKIAGEQLYQYYEVTRGSGCFPCFSTGNGFGPSNLVKIDFNPFGNTACDPVAKFSSGREEWLVDLW